MIFFFNKNASRGASSLVVILWVMAITLAIALSSASLAAKGIKLSGNTADSVVAFYTAESGVEEAMYKVVQDQEAVGTLNCVPSPPSCKVGGFDSPPAAASAGWTMIENARYFISVEGCVCIGTISSIQAIGEYGAARRSIEITF